MIWEASIGIYLVRKGFNVTSEGVEESRETGVDQGLAIAGR
jgi:hypothetical protein